MPRLASHSTPSGVTARPASSAIRPRASNAVLGDPDPELPGQVVVAGPAPRLGTATDRCALRLPGPAPPRWPAGPDGTTTGPRSAWRPRDPRAARTGAGPAAPGPAARPRPAGTGARSRSVHSPGVPGQLARGLRPTVEQRHTNAARVGSASSPATAARDMRPYARRTASAAAELSGLRWPHAHGAHDQPVRRHPAALADSALVPALVAPPVQHGPPGTMPWLPAAVSRFADGETHARRRALIEAELARLDPDALRTAATHAEPEVDMRPAPRGPDAGRRHGPDRTRPRRGRGGNGRRGLLRRRRPGADEAVAWLLNPRTRARRRGGGQPHLPPRAGLRRHRHSGSARRPPRGCGRGRAPRDARHDHQPGSFAGSPPAIPGTPTPHSGRRTASFDIAAATAIRPSSTPPNLFDVDRDAAPALSFGAGIRPARPRTTRSRWLPASSSVPDAGGAP